DFIEVYNAFAKGKFTIKFSDDLLSKTAVIFHGVFTNHGLNANFFTSEVPESMGYSGAFNSSIINIRNNYKNLH
ncbi:MAG: hypothetical protein ACTSRD_07085, partial [Promethearchaeota archaeon]